MNTARTFKSKRLALSLTQQGLANRSGVSLGSIKRFESTGQIAFYALLTIANVLDLLDDFEKIGELDLNKYITLKQIEEAEHNRKRGSIK